MFKRSKYSNLTKLITFAAVMLDTLAVGLIIRDIKSENDTDNAPASIVEEPIASVVEDITPADVISD